MKPHSMPELIVRKRDGGALTAEEAEWIIATYTADEIPHYQMSALLMAIVFRGMTTEELAPWTEAMLHSGSVVDLAAVDLPKVDKHSTGGVGDKISISLAPLVAACGAAVPMISGRGLGHTLGTLDKLESIPGFSSAVAPESFPDQLNRLGLVFAGQTETLVPADHRIYALRDATGTVPSIPLISSSIMSKKIAEDIDALVLDVKVGSGAFMKDLDAARELAQTMVALGKVHGVVTSALLTDMSQPLGAEVGHANEVRESIDVLRGEGPPDVTALVLALGTRMLERAGIATNASDASAMLEGAVSSGAGLERFAAVIAAQGGDARIVDDPGVLPTAASTHLVTAPRDGTATACDALAISRATARLGAGRTTKDDDIDPAVGMTILVKRGDEVAAGDPLAEIAYNDEDRLRAAEDALADAWAIGDAPAPATPLIFEEVR